MAGLLFRYHFQACYRNTVRDLALWRRTYHCSSIYLLGEHSEASETEPSDDKKTPNVQSLQFSGYSGLIDLAKQKPGIKKSEQFALALNEFTTREKYRKGHVPFIRVAMQRMEEFELEKDLVTYNKILEIFPKGKYKPRKWIDAVWPRPTPPLELCLEILTKMEENGVRPSRETYFIIKAAFGRTLPLDKCVRIMHLFDKYQDADPYEIRGGVPTDSVELCRLALFRITGGGAQLMEIKARSCISSGIVRWSIFNVYKLAITFAQFATMCLLDMVLFITGPRRRRCEQVHHCRELRAAVRGVGALGE